MALRNQPYLPLYVQDFLTDEKLNECSAATTGVYIKILCVLHKSEEYGTILLKQKDKQGLEQILNFAHKIDKQISFSVEVIEKALTELIDEKILIIEDGKLYQKRMVKDNAVSEARSEAGKKGGGNPNLVKTKRQTPVKTKVQTNSENESEYENITEYEKILREKNNFNSARKLYPGTKLGLDTEFINFKKKHKDWKVILPKLEQAINNQIEARRKSTGFVPEWKHFKTWINNRGWEEEIQITKNKIIVGEPGYILPKNDNFSYNQ